MKQILDVGCGNTKVKGAIGIDIVDLPEVDIVHDLNKLPWPFEDEMFDMVIMDDIIEHLENPLQIMEEVQRILKIGGRVYLKVVYWSHRYAFSDPTHIRFFTDISFQFFTGERRGYYSKNRFIIEKFDFIYDETVSRYIRNKRVLNFLAYFLNNVKQGMKVVFRKTQS